MKITDLRCGRVMEGEHVANIPGNSLPTDEQLAEYLGVYPGDSQYEGHKRSSTHRRAVLKRKDDGYFVVTVNTKFFKVQP